MKNEEKELKWTSSNKDQLAKVAEYDQAMKDRLRINKAELEKNLKESIDKLNVNNIISALNSLLPINYYPYGTPFSKAKLEVSDALKKFKEVTEEYVNDQHKSMKGPQINKEVLSFVTATSNFLNSVLSLDSYYFKTNLPFLIKKLNETKQDIEGTFDKLSKEQGKTNIGRVLFGILTAILVPFAFIIDLLRLAYSIIVDRRASLEGKSLGEFCAMNTYTMFHAPAHPVLKEAQDLLDSIKKLVHAVQAENKTNPSDGPFKITLNKKSS